MFSILDFGATPDSKTLCTKNIQAAIDACKKSGGTVYIPAGKSVHRYMHSIFHLFVVAGSMLQFFAILFFILV